jgi:single-stranded DNA-binding protein
MSQSYSATFTVSKISFFEDSEKAVISGFTTGLDGLAISVEIFGPNAIHCNAYLKKGSKAFVQGVWASKK